MSKKRVTIYVEEDEWSSLQVFLLKLSADRGERVSAGSYLMGKYKGVLVKLANPAVISTTEIDKVGVPDKTDVIKQARKKVDDMINKPDRSWDDSAPNPKAGKK